MTDKAGYRGMDAVAEYEESEEDDDEEEGVPARDRGRCLWKITTAESVYDMSMLNFLRLTQKPEVSPKCCWTLFTILFLMLFNAVLQFTVVFRVNTLVELVRSDRLDGVFAPAGNCRKDTQTKVYTTPLMWMAGNMPLNWDCGPLWPMLMSNVSVVDANNDGVWSEADGNAANAAHYNELFKKSGSLEEIFKQFLEHGKKGDFLYQKRTGSGTASGIKEIPMTWMKEEQGRITMCNNINVDLCGNLEVRGTLAPYFPDKNSSAHRVRACRDHYDWCYDKFGELYRAYTQFADATCEGEYPIWEPNRSIIMHRYERADRYNKRVNNRAVLGATYVTFLVLILILWWLIVLGEVRACLTYWFVIFNISSNGTVVKEEEDDDRNFSIQVQSISLCNKVFLFLTLVIPRTLIVLLLAFIGTDFLIIADNFGDLILNSVALGFLIEVDDMLFAGVASKIDKAEIAGLQDTQAEHSCPQPCILLGNQTAVALVFFVGLMAFAQVTKAFYMPFGKTDLFGAYECICHVEGVDCMAAQLLGGLDSVPLDYL